jgi:hypothetical protein
VKDIKQGNDKKQQEKDKKQDHLKEQEHSQKKEGAGNNEQHNHQVNKPFMLKKTDLGEVIGKERLIHGRLF